MNNNYSDIKFDMFIDEPIGELTQKERTKYINNFYKSINHKPNLKKKMTRVKAIAAIAACLALCIIVTPMGSTAWAAIKQLYVNIGTYMGMEAQNEYSTKVNITQTNGDLTVTLDEVVVSESTGRFSATIENNTGKNVSLHGASLILNGEEIGIGLGGYGIEKSEEGSIFTGYYDMIVSVEIPVNPDVEMVLDVGKEHFTYNFVLENEKIISDTRIVHLDKEYYIDDEKVILKDLIVTPITQEITVERSKKRTKEEIEGGYYDMEGFWWLTGVNNKNEKVDFSYETTKNRFIGYKDNGNDESLTYELAKDVTSYSLQFYYERFDDTGSDITEKIGDKFTINIE